MVTFEKFQELSQCQIVGSRLIAEVGGKRNVDVGVLSGKGFVLNEVGEQLVLDAAKVNDAAIAEVVAEMTQLPAAPAEQTFTERAATKVKGKK